MGHSNPIDGYTVITNNRKSIHKRAKCGSGGVALFVKKSAMLHYNVNVLDESFEDNILWVQFEHKISILCINVCVCYLSPDGSSHIVDPLSYFDKLLSQIYVHQTSGQFVICGDFNARCGGDTNYIESVDDVIEQTIIDYKKNHYRDILLDFLINGSCIMLNGRSMTHNDYTSISVKGVSVIDYAIVSHDHLHRHSNFQVIREHQLFNETDLVGRCDPDHNVSDHSELKWQYELDSVT